MRCRTEGAARLPLLPQIAVLVPALIIAAVCASLPARAEPLNRLVLRVNDQIATLYDYELRRADATQELMRRVQDPKEQQQELAQVGEIVFSNMFAELLLSSRADQLGIEPVEQEVDQAIARVKKNFEQNFGIKTDQEFQQALVQSGGSLEMLRAQLRTNNRMQQVLAKEVQAKIKVKDEDLRRLYRKQQEQYRVPEQVQLREVVVLEEGGLPAAERGRVAAEIRGAVAGGKSLADAAAPYAAKGQTGSVVELGWVSSKDLDPKLESAASKLSKGGISEPVDARGGLHLLQLLDRHPAHVRPFAEVQAQIQQQEQERMYQAAMVKYIADLETRSLVVADPPSEAANFRRRVGTGHDESMQGLAATGSTPASSGPEDAAAAVAGDGSAAAASGAHPAPIDTSDQKQGGLPAPRPAGAPAKEPVTIPPPSPAPPPPGAR